jgi:hypothetical protein
MKMSWYSFLLKDDWRLVKTISLDGSYGVTKGKIYYHLYESRKGHRKIKVATTLSIPSYMDIDKEAKKLALYHEKVYRWEMGRHDPDIPRYSQVPEEDTANALKGSI